MSKALDLAKFGRETAPTGLVVGDSDTQTLSAKTFSDMPVLSAGTVNGVVYLSGSKALATSSNLIFNGTLLTVSDIRDSSLTAGRITYAGVGGNLVDSANLVFDGTNLGVGAAPSAWSNAGGIDFPGFGGVGNWGLSGNGVLLNTNVYYASGSYRYKQTNAAHQYAILTGGHQWSIAPSGTAGSAISFTTAMTLNASGDFMVGTTAPAGRVTIEGSTSATTTLNALTLRNSLDGGVGLYFDNAVSNNLASIEAQVTAAGAGTDDGVLVFSTAANGTNTERARIDSGGNVGIGTSSPTAKLDVYREIRVTQGQAQYRFRITNTDGNARLLVDGDTSSLIFGTSGAGFGAVAAEHARIDSSGRLLVGTTSTPGQVPAGSVHINSGSHYSSGGFGRFWVPGQQIGTAQYAGLYGLANTYNAYYSGGWKSLGGGTAGAITIDEGIFSYSNSNSVSEPNAALTWTTRLVVDAGGILLVGKTATNIANLGWELGQNGGAQTVTISGTNQAFVYNNTSTAGTATVAFRTAGVEKGYIAWTNSSTSYVTSSDYRLKNSVAPMTGALAKVALLKPCTYKWNVDGSDGQGFIAHELAEVVPQCVTGEKDAVDAEGKPQYQGIDTSFLVATLTAAIQELKAEFDLYKSTHP
jgi:hypothetical protein